MPELDPVANEAAGAAEIAGSEPPAFQANRVAAVKAAARAPLPAEKQAELDAVVAQIRALNGEPAETAKGQPNGAEASPNPAPKTPATTQAPAAPAAPGAAPAPAAPAPGAKPPDLPADAPPQLLETEKRQARREYQLSQREKALAPKEKLYAALGSLTPDQAKMLVEADTLLRSGDPLEFFQKIGVPFEEVARRVAAKRSGQPMPPPPADAAVKALQQRLDASEAAQKKAAEEAAERDHEGKVAAYKETMRGALKPKSDDYHLVLTDPQGLDAVIHLQELHFNETGTTLPIEAAAAQIEANLEKHYAPIASAKKFAKLHAPQATTAAPPRANAPPVPGPAPKSPTLTSSQVPTTQAALPADEPENETDDDRIDRLLRKHKLYPGAQR